VITPGGTTHVLTARLAAPVTVAVVMGNLLWLTGNPWFLLLAGASFGAMLVLVASRARLDGLVVGLAHAPRVTVGDVLPCVLTVTNESPRTSSETLMCLHTRGLADLVVQLPRLAPGEQVSVPVTRAATARSVADGSNAHLVSRPALGVVVAKRPVQIPDHLVVHPALHDVRVLPSAGVGADGSVRPGPGAEVLGVRDWRSGDDRRRVHWRSTARTGRLTLLERGGSAAAELGLVLVGSDHAPDFEPALSAAASICDRALLLGRPVRVAAWHSSGPVLAPVRSRSELLDWWSSVRDTVLPDPDVFGAAVAGGFGGGELLVAGPPESLEDWFGSALRACPELELRRVQVAP
jgi:uncharacterized protein (DUF58 family)